MDNKTFIDKLSSKTGLDFEDIEILIEGLGAIIADSLQKGNALAIPTVGTFEPKLREEKITTHPASGKRLMIPPKLSVAFKPSAQLKQKLK